MKKNKPALKKQQNPQIGFMILYGKYAEMMNNEKYSTTIGK